MKLTTVLPDVFGSLADDIERNERSWRDVWEDLLQLMQPLSMKYILCLAVV